MAKYETKGAEWFHGWLVGARMQFHYHFEGQYNVLDLLNGCHFKLPHLLICLFLHSCIQATSNDRWEYCSQLILFRINIPHKYSHKFLRRILSWILECTGARPKKNSDQLFEWRIQIWLDCNTSIVGFEIEKQQTISIFHHKVDEIRKRNSIIQCVPDDFYHVGS